MYFSLIFLDFCGILRFVIFFVKLIRVYMYYQISLREGDGEF